MTDKNIGLLEKEIVSRDEKIKELKDSETSAAFLIDKNETLQNELKVAKDTETQLRMELEALKNARSNNP